MKTVREVLLLLLLVAALLLACEVVVSVYQFRAAVVQTAPTLVRKMDASLDQTQAILKQTYKITTDTRLTLDNLNKAAIDERFYFENQVPLVTTDIRKVLQTTDTTIASLQTIPVHANNLFDTTNTTIAGLQSTEMATTDSLLKLQTTLDLANSTLSDPNVKATMFNVAGITDKTNHMLFTADAVETKATHNYLHPPTNPLHRAWNTFQPFLLPAATAASRIIP